MALKNGGAAEYNLIQPIKAKAETQTLISRLSARYSLAPCYGQVWFLSGKN
jgi:hypothetical protein